MTISVDDDFFLDITYGQLAEKFANPWVTYGWKANDSTDPHGHFNHDLTKSSACNLADVSDRLDPVMKEAWDYTNHCLGDGKLILLRSYLNAHTYGVEGYYHKDTIITHKNSLEDGMDTMVIYIVDGKWDKDWGGETTILAEDQETILQSVLPKANRILIFPSKTWHCARSVSRKYYGFRKTLMFKYRTPGSDTMEDLCRFLYTNGAAKIPHAGNSSLLDHLVRVYSLLEDKGLDSDTCLAGGLHSVFGTNAFQKKLFEDDSLVNTRYYTSIIDLVKLFSVIDRPSMLENPIDFGDLFVSVLDRDSVIRIIPRWQFDALCWIEVANLLDQNELVKSRYPKLCKLWESK